MLEHAGRSRWTDGWMESGVEIYRKALKEFGKALCLWKCDVKRLSAPVSCPSSVWSCILLKPRSLKLKLETWRKALESVDVLEDVSVMRNKLKKNIFLTLFYHYFGTEDLVKDVYVQWFEINLKKMIHLSLCVTVSKLFCNRLKSCLFYTETNLTNY